jgi:hypothetical protein
MGTTGGPLPQTGLAGQAPAQTAAPTISQLTKIRAPPEFSGDRQKITQFLQGIELYLRINRDQYDMDEKKILLALSFMVGGTAASWKGTFAKAAMDANNFGTWTKFKTKIQTAFSPVQAKEAARIKLGTLCQTKDLYTFLSKF